MALYFVSTVLMLTAHHQRGQSQRKCTSYFLWSQSCQLIPLNDNTSQKFSARKTTECEFPLFKHQTECLLLQSLFLLGLLGRPRLQFGSGHWRNVSKWNFVFRYIFFYRVNLIFVLKKELRRTSHPLNVGPTNLDYRWRPSGHRNYRWNFTDWRSSGWRRVPNACIWFLMLDLLFLTPTWFPTAVYYESRRQNNH